MPLVRRGSLAMVVLVAAACSTTPSPVPVSSGPVQAATARPSRTPGLGSTLGPSGRPAVGSPASPGVPSAPAGAFDPTGVVPVVRVVAGGLRSPLDVADAGDGSGRIFVAEQAGRIRVVREATLVERPFLDITGRIASGGERGLLGIAFHPGYPTDPRVFVDYTDNHGDTVVSSFRVAAGDPDAADPDSEVVLLHVTQPFANHNGGGIHFGADGKLYIALGDGGSAGDPQGNGRRLDTLLAKILRIDVDGTSGAGAYAIPPDNPFLGTAGARPEIWLTGLRNPWRFSFDGATGDLWIGDVGQAAWEEIDVARRGAGGLDFGWNVMEGFHCFKPSDGCDQAGLTPPVAEYGHDLGCAVIGGVVVRDPRQGRLNGGYLFGDACSDNLWLMDPTGDSRREPLLVERMGRSLSSIDAMDDGTVYATALATGELLRISGPGG